MKKSVNILPVFVIAVPLFLFIISLLACVPGGGVSTPSGSFAMGSGALGVTGSVGNTTVSSANINVNFFDSGDNLVHTAITGASGTFNVTHDDLPPGIYTVIPEKVRFNFSPEQIENVEIQEDTNMNALSLNFDALPIPYVKGTIVNTNGVGVYGVTVHLTDEGVTVTPGGVTVTIGDGVTVQVGDSNIRITTTDANGTYGFFDLPSDLKNYEVTPMLYDSGFVETFNDDEVMDDEITADFQILRQDLSVYSRIGPGGRLVDISGDASSMVAVDDGIVLAYYMNASNKWKKQVLYNISSLTINDVFPSISSDGSTIVFGQPMASGDAGGIFVFRWDGTRYVNMADDGGFYPPPNIPVSIYGSQMGRDLLGLRVTVSGDGNTIAAFHHWIYNADGAVAIYEWDGTIWNKTADCPLPDNFGASDIDISSDGNTIVLGGVAPSGNYKGIAIFRRSDGWSGTIIDIGPDKFGKSVSISSDGTKIVSSRCLYEWDGASWNLAHQLGSNDFWTVSISGDGSTIVGKNYSGGPYFFRWDGTNWNTLKQIVKGKPYWDWVTSEDVLFGGGMLGPHFGWDASLSSDGSVALISDEDSPFGTDTFHRIPVR